MSRESIWSSIHYYERMIDDREEQIQEMTRKLRNLEDLGERLNQFSNRFSEVQSERLGTLNHINLLTNPLRMARAYQDGMRELLTGGSYRAALDGIQSAKTDTCREAQRVQGEIDALRQEIQRYGSHIWELRTELANMEDE